MKKFSEMASDENVAWEDVLAFIEQNLVNPGWQQDPLEGDEVEEEVLVVQKKDCVNTGASDCRDGVDASVLNRGECAPPAEEEKYSRLTQDDWDEEVALNSFAWWRGDFRLVSYRIYKKTILRAPGNIPA